MLHFDEIMMTALY